MSSQFNLIHNSDWDLLLVLDACRYDEFNNLYKDYLEGELRKARSLAGGTDGWLKRTFPDYYEWIYISANPMIEGLEEWRGKDHFEIIDPVWDYGWKHVQGIPTVPADTLNKAVRRNLSKYPDRKMIVHYMQPHAPYIGDIKLSIGALAPWIRERAKGFGPVTILKNKHIRRFETELKKFYPLRKLIGKIGTLIDEVGQSVSSPDDMPTCMREAVKSGHWEVEDIKEAYRENLKYVLEYVQKLVNMIRYKTIVVTADHGELFGEYDEYGHFVHATYEEKPLLFEVPWMEVG